jgi:photosynthetic reaction center cytochrome c subunit
MIVPLLGAWGLGKVTPAPATPAMSMAAPAVAADVVKVYFATGSADLAADEKAKLDPLVAKAKADAGGKVSVSGYHDAAGDDAANAALAKQRAENVRDALKAAGIGEDRIVLDKPMVAQGNVAGDNPEARRVEVSLK